MKNTRWTILAALLLAATSVAQAQAPAGETGVPGATAPTTATADSGTISNSAQTTETTTTTTSSSGIGPDGVSVEVEPGMEMSETTELANTGGEPILMSLLGLSMALGAFAVRKRVSA